MYALFLIFISGYSSAKISKLECHVFIAHSIIQSPLTASQRHIAAKLCTETYSPTINNSTCAMSASENTLLDHPDVKRRCCQAAWAFRAFLKLICWLLWIYLTGRRGRFHLCSGLPLLLPRVAQRQKLSSVSILMASGHCIASWISTRQKYHARHDIYFIRRSGCMLALLLSEITFIRRMIHTNTKFRTKKNDWATTCK